MTEHHSHHAAGEIAGGLATSAMPPSALKACNTARRGKARSRSEGASRSAERKTGALTAVSKNVDQGGRPAQAARRATTVVGYFTVYLDGKHAPCGWRRGVVFNMRKSSARFLDVGTLSAVTIDSATLRAAKPCDTPPRKLARIIDRKRKVLRRHAVPCAAATARAIATALTRIGSPG